MMIDEHGIQTFEVMVVVLFLLLMLFDVFILTFPVIFEHIYVVLLTPDR